MKDNLFTLSSAFGTVMFGYGINKHLVNGVASRPQSMKKKTKKNVGKKVFLQQVNDVKVRTSILDLLLETFFQAEKNSETNVTLNETLDKKYQKEFKDIAEVITDPIDSSIKRYTVGLHWKPLGDSSVRQQSMKLFGFSSKS